MVHLVAAAAAAALLLCCCLVAFLPESGDIKPVAAPAPAPAAAEIDAAGGAKVRPLPPIVAITEATAACRVSVPCA